MMKKMMIAAVMGLVSLTANQIPTSTSSSVSDSPIWKVQPNLKHRI